MLIRRCLWQIDHTNNVLEFTNKVQELSRTLLDKHLLQAVEADRAGAACKQFLSGSRGPKKEQKKDKFWNKLLRLLQKFKQKCKELQ